MIKKFKNNFITLPLTIKKKGTHIVPQRSGLNWGQRPGRNQDQAYIPIPAYIQRSGFLPKFAIKFVVQCDDGHELSLVRAQGNGKALQTYEDNAILGRYFRKRLGVVFGDRITIYDLEKYGRYSIDIVFLEDNKYFLDFSKNNHTGGLLNGYENK